MEFLVHIEITPPAAVPADTLARLRQALAAHPNDPSRAGHAGGGG